MQPAPPPNELREAVELPIAELGDRHVAALADAAGLSPAVIRRVLAEDRELGVDQRAALANGLYRRRLTTSEMLTELNIGRMQILDAKSVIVPTANGDLAEVPRPGNRAETLRQLHAIRRLLRRPVCRLPILRRLRVLRLRRSHRHHQALPAPRKGPLRRRYPVHPAVSGRRV